MTQGELFSDSVGTDFDTWVHTPAGREIANNFIRLAWQMRNRGFSTYSGWAIVNTIRWHFDLEHGPEAGETRFKINNNWIASLSRFAMEREPKLKGFFRVREMGKKKSKVIVVPNGTVIRPTGQKGE